ncbi:heme o synthase [Lutimonas halocynthiae]|uniref:heme o synthase n=1 Tax=Lutimonas halocynthiae TaxID=1446477 RepID=UPI0025B2C27A|nr:heme o synthase [Lutimonas halocynthiae]MDN3641690.1 heme o synthase [Lutimonas halocynthiae]
MEAVAIKHNVIGDLKELTKFGLSLSVVFSSIAGYLLAVDVVSFKTVVLLSIGGYCMVGASNAFNQIIERVPDAVMKRTMDRPIPTGRISVNTAMIIAVGLTITGLVILYNINEKTALFGAISIFLYTSAYTPLKPVTPLSVFVGAIPGAIPFMLGWVAGTGQFGIEAGMLFMIQFFWQFPHFWAIGWLQFDEYKKAGFNMMPTGEKNKKASRLILIYTVFMLIVSIFPVFRYTGSLYLLPVSAIVIFGLGLVMLYFGVKLHKEQSDIMARKLMLSSVLYITLIQIIFVIDKFLH